MVLVLGFLNDGSVCCNSVFCFICVFIFCVMWMGDGIWGRFWLVDVVCGVWGEVSFWVMGGLLFGCCLCWFVVWWFSVLGCWVVGWLVLCCFCFCLLCLLGLFCCCVWLFLVCWWVVLIVLSGWGLDVCSLFWCFFLYMLLLCLLLVL